MSINETEFVDIGNKFLNNDLNIKAENYENEENRGDEFSASESKCGEIFHSANGLFVFCCYYCSERFAAIEGFVSHFEEKHANTLITTKTDETPLNLRKVEETNEYLKSQTSETLPWITDNRIKIEENLDSGNCISTDLFNEDETNVEKTPKLYSETVIQCPKCPYTFRWKNLLVDHIRRIHKDYSGSLAKRAIRNPGANIESRIKIVKVQGNVNESVISEWPGTQELEKHVETRNPIIDSCEIKESCRQEDGIENETCQKPSFIELELTDGYKDSIGDENSVIGRPKQYKCSKCDMTFRLKHHLIRHFVTHSVELPFPCPHCGTAFKLKAELVLHLQKNHFSEDPPAILVVEKPFKCQMCPKQFVQSRSLKEHEAIHTGKKPYKCTYCSESYHIKRSFQRHIKNIHGIVKEEKVRGTETKRKMPKSPKSLKCGFCGEVLSTVELRVAHEKSHTPGHRHQCTICLKTFETKYCLDQHKPVHTGERRFKCSECPGAFTQKGSLTVHHKRVHLKEKNFSCDHCEKRFACKTSRKLHMRTHFNEKPYQCEECGRSFTTSGNLRFHKLHHTQTKRHSCEICQKSFYTTVGLRDHMPVHTKEKLFQCTVCQSKFTSKQHVRRHMKLHSGEKNYVCTICKKAYVRKDGLNLHMKSHGVVRNRKETVAND